MIKDEKPIQVVRNVFIGIDPASRKGGFALFIFCSGTRKAEAVSFEWPEDAFTTLAVYAESHPDAVICIENSDGAETGIFEKYRAEFRKDVKTMGIEKASAILTTKARGIGKNQAISAMTVRICKKLFPNGIVMDITPKQKGIVMDSKLVERAIAMRGMVFDNPKDKPTNEDQRSAFTCMLNGMANYKVANRKTVPSIPVKRRVRRWSQGDVDNLGKNVNN